MIKTATLYLFAGIGVLAIAKAAWDLYAFLYLPWGI